MIWGERDGGVGMGVDVWGVRVGRVGVVQGMGVVGV